ncbi:peptidyl-prolyl cis-trans isomerase FKBP11 isoform X1 [Lepidochelys kempii]|uniref:peptidyl-prolyl cis-trans isomerase FKBP11 isoform X1 n=1 Tax=Lepidochelys kempii TaxID=8472 RepID=UPI003C7036B7
MLPRPLAALLLVLLGRGARGESGGDTPPRAPQLETLVAPPEDCAARSALGDTVQIHYTGSLEDGRIIDTSLSRDPLQVELGKRQVIPADAVLQFDVELVGLSQASYWQKLANDVLPLLCIGLIPALLGLIGYHLYHKASSSRGAKKRLKEEKRNKAKKK